MASINKDSKGWRVLFVDPNGDRKQIRPGRGTNKATAEQIGRYVDVLVAHVCSKGILDRQAAIWLGDIGDKLHAKLVRAGLTEPRVVAVKADSPLLVTFIDAFIADGKTLVGNPASDSTLAKWRTARNHLTSVFPAKQTLEDVTPQGAKSFRQWLEARRINKSAENPNGEPMRKNSIRKIIASTKVIFNAAKRLELVTRNPFKFEASSCVTNRDRDYFVTAEMTQKLLDAAPDTQWKLIIALWRLAGLRKMEIHSLTWGDVLWDKGRFRVRATKTAHMEGREIRFVPIGPVLSYLEDAFQAALPLGKQSIPAETPVITRFSPTNVNLHKPFLPIIKRAGLKPWPKLIQNLRASCETEWLDSGMPAHVVANWIGHSVKVQNDNYAQVDDHHFELFNDMQAEKVAHQVAQNAREQKKTQEKQCATKRADRPQKPIRAIKKHGPKTVLNALERSRTSTSITDT